MKYLLILILLYCNTVQTKIDKPEDLKPIIQEVEKNIELNKQPEIKYKIVSALKNCDKYSLESYKQYESCVIELNQFKKEFDKLVKSKDLKIKELEKELEPWRVIKRFMIFIFVMLSLVLFMLIGFRIAKTLGKF